eukprot:2562658-Amphidinium_carterae.1
MERQRQQHCRRPPQHIPMERQQQQLRQPRLPQHDPVERPQQQLRQSWEPQHAPTWRPCEVQPRVGLGQLLAALGQHLSRAQRMQLATIIEEGGHDLVELSSFLRAYRAHLSSHVVW